MIVISQSGSDPQSKWPHFSLAEVGHFVMQGLPPKWGSGIASWVFTVCLLVMEKL